MVLPAKFNWKTLLKPSIHSPSTPASFSRTRGSRVYWILFQPKPTQALITGPHWKTNNLSHPLTRTRTAEQTPHRKAQTQPLEQWVALNGQIVFKQNKCKTTSTLHSTGNNSYNGNGVQKQQMLCVEWQQNIVDNIRNSNRATLPMKTCLSVHSLYRGLARKNSNSTLQKIVTYH